MSSVFLHRSLRRSEKPTNQPAVSQSVSQPASRPARLSAEISNLFRTALTSNRRHRRCRCLIRVYSPRVNTKKWGFNRNQSEVSRAGQRYFHCETGPSSPIETPDRILAQRTQPSKELQLCFGSLGRLAGRPAGRQAGWQTVSEENELRRKRVLERLAWEPCNLTRNGGFIRWNQRRFVRHSNAYSTTI